MYKDGIETKDAEKQKCDLCGKMKPSDGFDLGVCSECQEIVKETKDGFNSLRSIEIELEAAEEDLKAAKAKGDETWIREATNYVKEVKSTKLKWQSTGDAAPVQERVNHSVVEFRVRDAVMKDSIIRFEFPMMERPLVNRKLLSAGIAYFTWGVGSAANGRVEIELRSGPSGYTEQDIINALKGTRAVRDSQGCDICGKTPATKYEPAQAVLCDFHRAAFKEQKKTGDGYDVLTYESLVKEYNGLLKEQNRLSGTTPSSKARISEIEQKLAEIGKKMRAIQFPVGDSSVPVVRHSSLLHLELAARTKDEAINPKFKAGDVVEGKGVSGEVERFKVDKVDFSKVYNQNVYYLIAQKDQTGTMAYETHMKRFKKV